MSISGTESGFSLSQNFGSKAFQFLGNSRVLRSATSFISALSLSAALDGEVVKNIHAQTSTDRTLKVSMDQNPEPDIWKYIVFYDPNLSVFDQEPTNYPSLKAHFKAENFDPVTCTLSGTAGVEGDAKQAPGLRCPTLITDGGKPALSFEAEDDGLIAHGIDGGLIYRGSPFTIITVLKPISSGGDSTIGNGLNVIYQRGPFGSPTTERGDMLMLQKTSNMDTFLPYSVGRGVSTNTINSRKVWTVITERYDPSGSPEYQFSHNLMKTYQAARANFNRVVAETDPHFEFHLGHDPLNPDMNGKFLLRELMIFDEALTDSEILALVTGTSKKYGFLGRTQIVGTIIDPKNITNMQPWQQAQCLADINCHMRTPAEMEQLCSSIGESPDRICMITGPMTVPDGGMAFIRAKAWDLSNNHSGYSNKFYVPQ